MIANSSAVLVDSLAGVRWSRSVKTTSIVVAALMLVGSIPIVAGCGDSEPAFCAKQDELKKSVSELKDFNILEQGPKGLQNQFDEIQANALELTDAAKDDFPNESKRLSDAVASLSKSVTQLGEQGASSTVIAQIPGQVQAVIESAQALEKKIDEQCG